MDCSMCGLWSDRCRDTAVELIYPEAPGGHGPSKDAIANRNAPMPIPPRRHVKEHSHAGRTGAG